MFIDPSRGVKLLSLTALIFGDFLKLAIFPIFRVLKLNCGVYPFRVGVFIERCAEMI